MFVSTENSFCYLEKNVQHNLLFVKFENDLGVLFCAQLTIFRKMQKRKAEGGGVSLRRPVSTTTLQVEATLRRRTDTECRTL